MPLLPPLVESLRLVRVLVAALGAGRVRLLAHSNRGIKDITVNGRPVGESGQAAAYRRLSQDLGDHALSGDQDACDEILTIKPKAETVATKRLVRQGSFLGPSPVEVRQQIHPDGRRAVQRIGEFSPWIIEGPVGMRFEFLPEAKGGESKRRPPREYRGRTALVCFQDWLR